jgi:hypothetical protein
MLTAASEARVRAAVEYVTATHDGRTPLVVFGGGWAEACEGAAAPPAGCREGDLMLARAREAGLHRVADLRAETRSRSTLENLLHVVDDGVLAGHAFDASRPLGLVSHAGHLARIRYLAGKVLGLRGAALLDVPAAGADPPTAPWRSERAARVAARLCFLGVRDGGDLLRRERRMVAALRRVERAAAAGRGRSAAGGV